MAKRDDIVVHISQSRNGKSPVVEAYRNEMTPVEPVSSIWYGSDKGKEITAEQIIELMCQPDLPGERLKELYKCYSSFHNLNRPIVDVLQLNICHCLVIQPPCQASCPCLPWNLDKRPEFQKH